MHHGVDARQQVGRGSVGPPLPLVLGPRRPPDQPNHPVPAGRQKRREGRPDQTGCARDRDDHRLRARRRGIAMRGQVVGELAMPVDERGPQRRTGHRGVDLVAHRGATAGRLGELVGVPPPADHAGRQGPRPGRGQHVDEAVRRVETVPIVLGDPAQPAGQTEHRPAVGQRLGFGHHLHRLPGRNEPGHRARPGVPGEHLGQRVVDDAFVLDAHGPFPWIKTISLSDSESMRSWIARRRLNESPERERHSHGRMEWTRTTKCEANLPGPPRSRPSPGSGVDGLSRQR